MYKYYYQAILKMLNDVNKDHLKDIYKYVLYLYIKS